MTKSDLMKMVEEKSEELMATRQILFDLKLYVSSSKFHNYPYVNVSDVLLRIEEGL